jgi:monoamine oxidase
VPLELGAEFIHGQAEDTFAIVRAASLPAERLPDDHYISRRGTLSPMGDFWEVTEEVGRGIARRLARGRGRDFSLADYLSRARLSPQRAQLIQDFVEGYHAAHLDRVSARVMATGAGDDDSGDAQFRIAAGYDAVIEWLHAGLAPGRTVIRFNAIATELRWKRGAVTLECINGLGADLRALRARCAIIAVPHALLRAGALRVRPGVKSIQHAIACIEVGQVFKILLRFREAFWFGDGFVRQRLESRKAKPADINFIHAHGTQLPTWWTQLPSRAPLLTGWSGGPKAEAMLAQDTHTQVDLSLAALAEALGVPRNLLDDQLESWAMHDWQADPFSRGAYSYPGVGAAAAQAALSKPVERTLAFAGEYTDAEQIGTVAAAIASGKRAARSLFKPRPATKGAKRASQ